jgi:hypothetical protein
MSFPFCPAIRLAKVGFVASVGWLMSCQSWKTTQIMNFEQGEALAQEYVHHYNPHRKQAKWVGPPAAFARFRRANPAAAPVITGYVDIQESEGQLRPLPGAIITIDNAHTFADKAGNYVQAIGPGRHHVRVGGVGFLWSEAPSLHIERGDSIRVTAHLLPEFRPTIN